MIESYPFKRRQFMRLSALTLGSSLLAACNQSNSSTSEMGAKLDTIKLGLGWKAEAEYGGYYQAVAMGIYRQYGLDVTIEPTPPRSNVTQLLLGGLIDFMIGNAAHNLKVIEQNIPKVTVAAIFQKEIKILLAHPGVNNDSFEQLKGKPIYISSGANTTYWPVLKAKYNFTDDQQRPYNFNISPFLADQNSAQQGILTSEPYLIEKQGGFKPVILPLSEAGYNPYAFTIETTQKLVEKNPDLVERFVDASIKGWYSYLENPAPANKLIKQDNPEMIDDLLAYSLDKLEEYEIINSGDALNLGIGAMTEQKWSNLIDELTAVGILNSQTNYQDAYTLQFVNKGIDYYRGN